VWQPAFQPLGDAAAWLLAAVLVTFGAWRVCSMSGEGGGRASQIYVGWRWLVVGCRSLEDFLARAKCWGRFWSPEVALYASLAVSFWWLATLAGLALKCGPIWWPKCSGDSSVGGAVSVGLAAAEGDLHPMAPSDVDLGSSSRCRCSGSLGKVPRLPCR
jgi:hypothetical protein